MESVLELLDISTILIIFAPPRTGKTCFMSYLASEAMYDYDRTAAMRSEVMRLNYEEGFNLEIPPNVVSANYDITGYKYLCSEMKNRRINPYRLGIKELAPPEAKLHLDIPYGVYFIQEGQRYLNSRRFNSFPDFQSRWYETLGHNYMNAVIDCQRPNLIDKNVRDLCTCFCEIKNLDILTNKFGDITGLRWEIRLIKNSFDLDLYLQSGGRDESYFTTEHITADYNVFDIYDSFSCRARFYKGREKESFEFDSDVDDELPSWFYKSESKKEKAA